MARTAPRSCPSAPLAAACASGDLLAAGARLAPFSRALLDLILCGTSLHTCTIVGQRKEPAALLAAPYQLLAGRTQRRRTWGTSTPQPLGKLPFLYRLGILL